MKFWYWMTVVEGPYVEDCFYICKDTYREAKAIAMQACLSPACSFASVYLIVFARHFQGAFDSTRSASYDEEHDTLERRIAMYGLGRLLQDRK